MIEWLLICFLALWLVLSTLGQLTTWSRVPKRLAALVGFFSTYDFFSLLPAWNFFAPNPGTTDYHLLYRDKLHNGEYSVWRELRVDKERGLLKGIWNPNKRQSKIISDVAGVLTQLLGGGATAAREQAEKELSGDGDVDRAAIEARTKELLKSQLQWVKLTMPYLLILTFLSNVEHPVFSAATQFMFVETRQYDATSSPEIVFVSEEHELP